MKKGTLIFLSLLAIAGWFGRDSLIFAYMKATGQQGTQIAESGVTTEPSTLNDGKNYVYDIVVHTPEQIYEVLQHADKISAAPRSGMNRASISMVLHGPEIDIFSIENYPKYREIVDLAAKLDAYNIIEVKMCQTMMRKRGLKNGSVPGFIELVPYAPEELEKLRQRGYVVL